MQYGIFESRKGYWEMVKDEDGTVQSYTNLEAAKTALPSRYKYHVVPFVAREIGDATYYGHETLYSLALGEYLHVNYLFTTMTQNGNSRGYVQLLLRNSNGNIENVSRDLAKWFGFRFSEKWNAVIISKHGTWVSTVEKQVSPHFELGVTVKEVIR